MFPGGQNHPNFGTIDLEGDWFRVKKELKRGKPDRRLHGCQLRRVKDINSSASGRKNITFVLCLSLYFPTNYEIFD